MISPNRIAVFASFFTLIFVLACEPVPKEEVRFRNKVKGKKATNLTGSWVLSDSKSIADTVRILETSAGVLAWVNVGTGDTVFHGPIKRRKNLYFTHWPGTDNTFHLNCFRIRGDSLYNPMALIAPMSSALVVAGHFKEVEQFDVENDHVWLIDNEQKETVRAFRTVLDTLPPHRFERLQE